MRDHTSKVMESNQTKGTTKQVERKVAKAAADVSAITSSGLRYPSKEVMLSVLNAKCRPSRGEALITPKELGDLWGYKNRMPYDILDGKRVLKAEHWILFAFEAAKRGDVEALEIQMPNTLHVASGPHCQPDGRIDDNISRVVETLGKLPHCHRVQSKREGKALVSKLREEVEGLDEEIELLGY